MEPIKLAIAVFGATGRTGCEFLAQAIQKGHTIKALVRNKNKLANTAGIETIEGDIYSKSAISRTMNGCSVVVSFLGHVKGSAPNMQTEALKNILAEMNILGINRLIDLTGANIPQHGDKPSVADTMLRFMLKTLAPARFYDGVGHVSLIVNSGLDYTIIRAPLLTNGPLGNYKAGRLKIGFLSKISRKNVAAFALNCIENGLYIKDCPQIAG